MKSKRIAYFLIGALFTPVFWGLTVLLLTHRPQHGSAAALYAISILFCAIGVLTASAFRAAFRTPPWWIISPEKTRQSTKLLIERQLMVLSKKQVKFAAKQAKFANKRLKAAEKALKLAERLEELGRAEPSAGANPGSPHPST